MLSASISSGKNEKPSLELEENELEETELDETELEESEELEIAEELESSSKSVLSLLQPQKKTRAKPIQNSFLLSFVCIERKIEFSKF
jgi:hypothetical protein